jgi:PsbP-like protein
LIIIYSNIKEGNNLKNSSSLIFGILGILVLVVFASGCTSNSMDLSQTFSNGGISFNYPSDMNHTNSSSVVSSGSSVADLGTLASSNGLTIAVSKADLSSSPGVTILQLKDLTKENIKNGSSSAQVLSDNITTVNGVKVYELLMTLKDPSSNSDMKYLTAITGKEGQAVYYVQFIADPSTFDSNKELINNIINTIRIQ